MYPEGGCAFRVGLVQEQDTATARLRVTFPDRDQMRSWWLPVVVPKTQNDKAYWIPDIGEQVVCLMDEHDEAGAVLGAIYSKADTTPVDSGNKWHLSFSDGAAFDYDRGAHVLSLAFSDGSAIKYDAGAHALSITLASGASMALSANGASVAIDSSGNARLTSAGLIQLGSGQLKGVARLGDQVTCPAGTGAITSASTIVQAE